MRSYPVHHRRKKQSGQTSGGGSARTAATAVFVAGAVLVIVIIVTAVILAGPENHSDNARSRALDRSKRPPTLSRRRKPPPGLRIAPKRHKEPVDAASAQAIRNKLMRAPYADTVYDIEPPVNYTYPTYKYSQKTVQMPW
jgi:hypothetical protein